MRGNLNQLMREKGLEIAKSGSTPEECIEVAKRNGALPEYIELMEAWLVRSRESNANERAAIEQELDDA